jgi:hypothetical protein
LGVMVVFAVDVHHCLYGFLFPRYPRMLTQSIFTFQRRAFRLVSLSIK